MDIAKTRWMMLVAFILLNSLSIRAQILTPKQQGELWGYVDESGNFVIQPAFKQVCEFSHGVAAVIKGESIGLIDTQGNMIQRAVYSQCPLLFGESAFQPNYRGERKYIGWLAHELQNSASAQLGVVWVDNKGKIIITQAKRIYTLDDRIPDVLWDY
jgi:hypothetical protein